MPKSPEFNVTTHPSVVEGVAELVLEAGATPAIGDGPGGTGYDINSVYEITGMADVARRLNLELVNLREAGSRSVQHGEREFFLTRVLDRFDKLISLSKLKTHSLTIFTGAIKNTYGLIPGFQKAGYHKKYPYMKDFSEFTVHVYMAVKPTLNIMDAVEGMDGNGPSGGRTRKIGALLLSEDGVALDKVALELVNRKKRTISTLESAEKLQAGNTDPYQIHILGAKPEEFDIDDFRFPKNPQFSLVPRWVINLFAPLVWVRPYLQKNLCNSCQTCAKSCPVEAITMVDNYPRFNYHKCISCFCCSEVCPQGALYLKRSLAAKFMR